MLPSVTQMSPARAAGVATGASTQAAMDAIAKPLVLRAPDLICLYVQVSITVNARSVGANDPLVTRPVNTMNCSLMPVLSNHAIGNAPGDWLAGGASETLMTGAFDAAAQAGAVIVTW